MDYLHVKTVHVAAVIVTVVLFVARFGLSLRSNSWRHHWLLRVGPHLNDTVLLASAGWLCVVSSRYPGTDSWLTAKVVALVLYIVAGSVALRFGRTALIRAFAFCVSIACIAYIVGAALHHSPQSWLG